MVDMVLILANPNDSLFLSYFKLNWSSPALEKDIEGGHGSINVRCTAAFQPYQRGAESDVTIDLLF